MIYFDDMLIMNQTSTHLLRDRDTVFGAFTAFRLSNQLEEISSDPLSSRRVLGIHTGFNLDDFTFTTNENQSDNFSLPSAVTSRLYFRNLGIYQGQYDA